MAEEFVREVSKWYASYRTYAAAAAIVAAVMYPIFGIDFTQVQQEHLAKNLEIAVPAVVSVVSAILSLVSRAKSHRKNQQRRATDRTTTTEQKETTL